MQDFRNLDVWAKAHELTLDVHRTLARAKRIDAHSKAQMIRAANSIAANIVEGCGHESRAELARFANMSIASASELEYWLLLSRDLGQLPHAEYDRLAARTIEVRKMLFGLRRAIRTGTRAAPSVRAEASTTPSHP